MIHRYRLPWAVLWLLGANLASAETGQSAAPHFILKRCYQIGQDTELDSATRTLNPAHALKNYLHWSVDQTIAAGQTVSVLQPPKYGGVEIGVLENGYRFFASRPAAGYVGKDRVVFGVELDGKRYQVDTTLLVVEEFEYQANPDPCPDDQMRYGPASQRQGKVPRPRLSR